MKLVPLLRFWGRKRTEDDADLGDEFPEEILQLPPEDEAAASEDGETREEAAEETPAADPPEQEGERVDDLLNVFLSVEEEFVDNSSLLKDVDDVPATELLEELRVLASAFNVPSRQRTGTPDS
jgi:hypothetical protein